MWESGFKSTKLFNKNGDWKKPGPYNKRFTLINIISVFFFLRSMQSCDTTDFFVIESSSSKVNEESQGNQSQGDANKKKPLFGRQKFKNFYSAAKKFYSAPITKFWFNVVRSWYFSLYTRCICSSLFFCFFLLTCSMFLLNYQPAVQYRHFEVEILAVWLYHKKCTDVSTFFGQSTNF